MEKRKEKSASAWADRKAAEDQLLSDKIGKRELNITARKKGIDPSVLAQQQAEKAAEEGGAAPAAKRPRLFMHFKQKDAEAAAGTSSGGGSNRPGFEGKKKGFLNQSGEGGGRSSGNSGKPPKFPSKKGQ